MNILETVCRAICRANGEPEDQLDSDGYPIWKHWAEEAGAAIKDLAEYLEAKQSDDIEIKQCYATVAAELRDDLKVK